MAGAARFPYLLFDLGSTLMYNSGKWLQTLQEGDEALLASLQSAGLGLDGEAFKDEFDRRLGAYFVQRDIDFIETGTAGILRDLLADLGFTSLPEETWRLALQAWYQVSEAYWLPEPEALPVLETLRQRGHRMGMISNAGDDEDVQRLVDKCGLRPYFDFIFTSAAVGIRKPDVRIFQAALACWEAQPSQAAMIGDNLQADVLGARNAGIFAVWLTRRAETPANLQHLQAIVPDAVAHSLADLPDLLR
ncbi:MAG TPA: HAD family hydrolase [Anaerolineales bacterium]|nr:HAD family hydrolase [Anaerolineales bacterium]